MQIRKCAVAAVCVAFFGTSLCAGTVYVGTENAADDALHGASAEAPYASLQYAVDALGDAGGTVSVAKGTYAADCPEDFVWSVRVTNAVSIIGATGNPEDVILEPKTKKTAKRSFVIQLNHPQARLRYLTVANGYSQDKNGKSGFNVYIGTNGGTVEDCVIRDAAGGHWSSEGLGLWMATGRVSRCVFKNNSSTRGQTVRGAALCANDGLVENCLFTGSSCQVAATVAVRGYARMVNCTIAGNTGTTSAGVMTLAHSSYGHIIPQVVNCAILNNTVTSDTTGHAHVWDGKEGCFYNCASELASFGTAAQKNVLSAVPYFKDATAGNYRFSSVSSLFDAGCDPTPYLRAGMTLSTTDLDGNPRAVDTIDIGCYENQKNEVECGLSVTTDSYVLPTTVTLKALPSGASGTPSFVWSLSNEVSDVVETVDAGTAATTTWSAVNPGIYSAYLTLTDNSGAHLFSLMRCIKLSPKDLYVDKTSENPAYPYDTPAKAATTVHDAVAAAYDGATIHVAEGEYTQDSVVSVTDAITILGADPAHPEKTLLRSTRSGGFDDHTRRVMFVNNAGAKIAHLTMADGKGDNTPGACLRVEAMGGTVSNCVIRGGSASNHSVSGIGACLSAGLLSHCVISNCVKKNAYAPDSTAVAVRAAGSARVSNCLMTMIQTSAKLEEVESNGGIIAAIDGEGAVMENCTIAGNIMSGKYAAVRVSSPTAVIRNCVIANNLQTNGVDLALAWTNRADKIVVTDTYVNCVADAEEPINETCRVAPTSTLFQDIAACDYTPAMRSILRERGVATSLSPSVDLAGNPRVFGRKIDIGCFERQTMPGMVMIFR